jgi:D-glutamate cyclase
VIDDLLALDPGHRGIGRFFVRAAAAAAARTLVRGRRALLTTGFALGPGLPETDGPPGAASLGRALRLLGLEVVFVTDAVTVPPLEAALKVLGEPAEIVTFHATTAGAGETARRLLAEHAPSHLVAIERPGRNRAGDYLSMRGESVREWNGPLDALFLARGARGARRPITIGVGDGGNEIGMGNVRTRVARVSPTARRFASIVTVDHLVVAGTSNWGAYGIVAELSRLAGRDLLHSSEDEQRMIAASVEAGAVDGVTRRAEPTVDRLPFAAHTGILELLRVAATAGGSSAGGAVTRSKGTPKNATGGRVR